MSPRPAAPSSASISACVTTSPSECPARPRGEAISTPPRTSGTPPAKAWASTPIPTRRSGTVEGLRQLVQRADAQAAGFGADLEVRPRAAADLNGDEPGLARGHDVVVEAVADVGHLVRSGAALGDDAGEELRRGLLDTPARRRGDDVDRQLLAACPLLELRALVAGDADEVAGAVQPLEARKRIGVEVLRGVDDLVARLAAEELEDAPVVLAARDRRAERGPHDVRGHTEPLGVLGPVARLVDERLADVEEHGLHSHDATNSRSEGSVTFSRRGSPGTTFTRPPARSTSAAQSLASPPPAAARRRTGATKACGVCTATRSSRGTVSTTASPRTRFTVSAKGRPGTAPSQPSPSGSSTRPTTSSVTSGRAASCTSATAASSGTSASASRTDSARVGPPVTQDETLPQPSSSASRTTGSSQPSGAATTIASTHPDASSRSRLSASSGRPRSAAKAFGLSRPRRSPRPAAATIAQTLTPTPPGSRQEAPLAVPISGRAGYARASV